MSKLILKYENFELFEPLIRSGKNIVKIFRSKQIFYRILCILEDSGFLDAHLKNRYFAIGKTYLDKGVRGILSYDIEKAYNGDGKIDKAYTTSFKKMRTEIEYKIPRALSLFESIFIFVAERRGYSMSEFSLSRIINLFETGVESAFGVGLVEYGFPVDVIRKIEFRFEEFIFMDALEGKRHYLTLEDEIDSLLDDYEKLLIKKAVESIQ